MTVFENESLVFIIQIERSFVFCDKIFKPIKLFYFTLARMKGSLNNCCADAIAFAFRGLSCQLLHYSIDVLSVIDRCPQPRIPTCKYRHWWNR